MTLLSRLKYPDTCTFSVAQAHNPIDQYMYECIDCGQKICLVCRDLCHPYCAWEEPNDEPTPASVSSSVTTASAKTVSNPYQSPTPLRRRVRHNLRRLGFVSSTFCCCIKTTCRAIGSIDPGKRPALRGHQVLSTRSRLPSTSNQAANLACLSKSWRGTAMK